MMDDTDHDGDEWDAVRDFDEAIASGGVALAVPMMISGRRDVIVVGGEVSGDLDELSPIPNPWNVFSTPCIQYSATSSIPTTCV